MLKASFVSAIMLGTVVAAVLCAAGCSQKGPLEGVYIDIADCEVPVTEAVEVPHDMDGTMFFGATDVVLVDSVLMVVRQYSDHFIHLVDLRSGETVAKVQHFGRGPGEALSTYYVGVSDDGEYFWAYDMQQDRINVYCMGDVLSGCGLPVRSLVFSDRFSRGVVSEVVMAGDSIYTVPEGINQDVGRFVVYDSTFNNPREMGVWPALEGTDGLPGPAYSSVFSGSLAYIPPSACAAGSSSSSACPSDSSSSAGPCNTISAACPPDTPSAACPASAPSAARLAIAHRYVPLVSIYSMDGSLVSNTWGPDEFRQEFSINENNVTESGGFEVYSPMVGWGEDVRNLYSALRYHDGRLYALFTGDRMRVDEDDAVSQQDCSILVLDCDGVPLESIRMDRLLMRFDIDPETRDIWGFDVDSNLYHYKY